MNHRFTKAESIAGLALIGPMITGVMGLLLTVISVLANNLISSSLTLIAAALAFGLVVNAIFMK